MPFKEALFWVGLTVFGTGLYFLIDRTEHNRWSAWSATLIGTGAVAYSIYVQYHENALGLPVWFYLQCVTWLLIGLDVYGRHFRRPAAQGKHGVESRELFLKSAQTV
jgi:hypothetical protein